MHYLSFLRCWSTILFKYTRNFSLHFFLSFYDIGDLDIVGYYDSDDLVPCLSMSAESLCWLKQYVWVFLWASILVSLVAELVMKLNTAWLWKWEMGVLLKLIMLSLPFSFAFWELNLYGFLHWYIEVHYIFSYHSHI